MSDKEQPHAVIVHKLAELKNLHIVATKSDSIPEEDAVEGERPSK